MDGFSVEGLDLAGVERLVERVLAEWGGVLSRTMLPIWGRPPLYGMILEQVSEESSPFLVDVSLVDQDIEPFFVGVGRFTTFTLFFQAGGNLLAYRNHPCFSSYHSNIADLLCFLA